MKKPMPRWLITKINKSKKRHLPIVIKRSAVEEFLNRERRDFSTYTRKSDAWLQRRADELPVQPPVWDRLRREQRVGLIAGAEMRKFCFWYDMGMGKTFLAIALARYFRKLGTVKRVLVLVPNKINKYEWVSDLKKNSRYTSHLVLTGSSRNKWRQLQEGNEFLVIETYAGLVRLLCSMIPADKTHKKPRLVVDPKLIKEFVQFVQGIVMDESIMIARKSGHGSLMHRVCRFIAKRSKIAFMLNGTPFGRDPTEMWGQFHIIDSGETLGESLGLFRAAFFTASQNHWGGFDWTFDKDKQQLLNEMITNRSIRYEAEESTLPGITSIVKHVPMPRGALEYYERARQQIIAASGNYSELKNVFMRMRQISSGFVGYGDDETGERAQYEFETNPKLDMLMSLIEGLSPRDKMVVFHQFTYSGDMIAKRLKEAKIGFARLYGKTKDPDAELVRFQGNKCQVFVLQNDSGGFGLDRLKVARYGVYYESPISTVLRVQTGRRIRRQGSDHSRVFIYDLVVPDTVDAQILDAHAKGIDLFASIVDRAA
jgi:SNF2 family DNA or RNA helicase